MAGKELEQDCCIVSRTVRCGEYFSFIVVNDIQPWRRMDVGKNVRAKRGRGVDYRSLDLIVIEPP